MRRFLIAVVAAVSTTAFTQIAAAADMPVKAPVIKAPVVVPYNWTGFYIGLNAGYGWNTSTGDPFCIDPGGVVGGGGCGVAPSGTVKPAGGLAGAQIGYNFQSGAWVYGLEADIQWSGIKDSQTATVSCCVPVPVPVAGGAFTASANLRWFGTLRGRLGVAAFDRGLVYATGGLIYGNESISQNWSFPGLPYPASASSTRTGWTVGGGLEYAFADNLTGKVEGLYYDMGSETIGFFEPSTGYTGNTTFDYRGFIVRGGLNWKFM